MRGRRDNCLNVIIVDMRKTLEVYQFYITKMRKQLKQRVLHIVETEFIFNFLVSWRLNPDIV